MEEEPISYNVKFERGGFSEKEKHTRVTCGKRHYGKYLRALLVFLVVERMIIR